MLVIGNREWFRILFLLFVKRRLILMQALLLSVQQKSSLCLNILKILILSPMIIKYSTSDLINFDSFSNSLSDKISLRMKMSIGGIAKVMQSIKM